MGEGDKNNQRKRSWGEKGKDNGKKTKLVYKVNTPRTRSPKEAAWQPTRASGSRTNFLLEQVF
jgi:hypothetical protein